MLASAQLGSLAPAVKKESPFLVMVVLLVTSRLDETRT